MKKEKKTCEIYTYTVSFFWGFYFFICFLHPLIYSAVHYLSTAVFINVHRSPAGHVMTGVCVCRQEVMDRASETVLSLRDSL